MIGAEAPHKLAQELEAAAKNEDTDFVMTNHERFLEEYGIVLDALGKVVVSEDVDSDEFEIGDNGAMEFLPDDDE